MWGSGVRPSQFPFLMGSPSLQPRARGAGLPEGHGRARTANRHPPSVGPGWCPGQRLRWPPRIVGAPPGPRGHAPSPRGGHGCVSGGLCGWGGPHKPCRGGSGYGAPHSEAAFTRAPREESPRGGRMVWCPLRGGCHARPAGGVTHGGRGATPRGATGRPCQCTGAHKIGAGGADGGRTGRP